MIDETVLERLLQDEAATYEPPADGPDRIERLAVQAGERRPSRTPWYAAAAAAVLVGLVAVGPSLDLSSGNGAAKSTPAFEPTSRDQTASGGGGGPAPSGPPAAKPGAAPGTTTGSTTGGTTGGLTGGAPAADAAHVVRTGEVTVEVPTGRVATALRDAARIATRLGGYVSESQGETASDKPSGFVTLRVPVASFDTAVEEASKLGEIKRSTSRGQDVSDQVTDTAARLRSLRATRGQLQTLMSRADTVGEVLAVQDKVNDVQTQIEKLQATQASLTDRTTYGTVKVEVVTEGTEQPAPEEKSGFAKAWDDAVDAFVGGFEGVVRASGPIAFVLIVGGLLFLVARRVYRSWIRTVV